MLNDFDKFDRKFSRRFGFMAIIGIILNLAFWLGLIFGAIWIVKYFKIF